MTLYNNFWTSFLHNAKPNRYGSRVQFNTYNLQRVKDLGLCSTIKFLLNRVLLKQISQYCVWMIIHNYLNLWIKTKYAEQNCTKVLDIDDNGLVTHVLNDHLYILSYRNQKLTSYTRLAKQGNNSLAVHFCIFTQQFLLPLAKENLSKCKWHSPC